MAEAIPSSDTESMAIILEITLFMPTRFSPMVITTTRWLKKPIMINANWESKLKKLFRSRFFKRIFTGRFLLDSVIYINSNSFSAGTMLQYPHDTVSTLMYHRLE